MVGEEFKPIFADPLEHWKDSESKCVSFERNFLFCKLRREGSQRGWEERGLFLEVSVNCDRVLLLIHKTILDPETGQTSSMKRGKGLRGLSCVCPTEPSRTALLSLQGRASLGQPARLHGCTHCQCVHTARLFLCTTLASLSSLYLQHLDKKWVLKLSSLWLAWVILIHEKGRFWLTKGQKYTG